MSDHYDERYAAVDQLAGDLAVCRQRGLAWLDRRGPRQAPVRAPELERLAHRFATSKRLATAGRAAQIQVLLRQALDELSRQGHDADARLIRDLFFGDSQTTIMHAGELLDIARRNFGEPSETRFREIRTNALGAFATFLIQFVDEVEHELNGVEARANNTLSSHDEHDLVIPSDRASPGDHRPNRLLITTGHVGEQEDRFIELLAEAINVTIIGHTHEQLTSALSSALALKRERNQREDAFWRSLNIVFLSDTLLDYVNDERDTSPDRHEAVRNRRRAMTWGRRSVRLLLRHTSSTHWALYESPFLPPFAGTLFELPDRRHLVQLLIRRPQTATSDNLYFEFEDLDGYFYEAFKDVVGHSIDDNRPVPTGIPDGSSFLCRGQLFRKDALRDGSNIRTWLPMVLIVTTRKRRGQIEPMLQLRTKENAIRELSKVSHLSGHVFQEDHSRSFGATAVSVPVSFGLTSDCTTFIAQRRVQMETGDDTPPALRPVTTGFYLNHDKEHLMFFVYALDLPNNFDFDDRSEMHHFPVPELLAIRANHALRTAAELCRRPSIANRAWAAAAELVALNLTLHGYHDLGTRLGDLAQGPRAELDGIAEELAQLVEQTACSCTSLGNEIQISGLSGWQYREFFTVLMPLYAEIGVPGAAEALAGLVHDECMRTARDRLAELYQDEDLMRSIPIEL